MAAASTDAPVLDIAPKWRPLAVPDPMVPDGSEPFPLAVDTASGVVVVGGWHRVFVFQVFDRQRLWYSVPGFVRLTGFAVHEGRLYVCDGWVLSAWSLSDALTIDDKIWGRCLAGINVVTGQTIDPVAAETSREPTGDIYGLPTRQRPTFSPPVIKVNEMGGAPGGMLFVLGSDDTIRALDAGLTTTTTYAVTYPCFYDGVPMLGIVEDPDASTCKLFYLDNRLKAVVGVDASTRTLRALGQWNIVDPRQMGAGSGRPILPSRGTDKMLWMGDVSPGGVYGIAIYAPVPGSPPVRRQGGGGWGPGLDDYDVSPAEKLALFSKGTSRAMQRYAGKPLSGIPQDWMFDVAKMSPLDKPAWALFWPHADEAPEGAPRLIFEIDRDADADRFGYRVYVGQTVMVQNEDYVANFPPPANVLVRGTLSLGVFAGGIPAPISIANRPVIVDDQLIVLLREGAANFVLAAFSLKALAAKAYPLAQAELDRIAALLTPLKIHVDQVDARQGVHSPLAPYPSQHVVLEFDDGSHEALYINEAGDGLVDGGWAGRVVVAVLFGGFFDPATHLPIGRAPQLQPVMLQHDKVNAFLVGLET